jgi:putative transcriptional regulator
MNAPTNIEVRKARMKYGLTQSAAAYIVHVSMRTWQDWEGGVAPMHRGLWELFLIKCSFSETTKGK